MGQRKRKDKGNPENSDYIKKETESLLLIIATTTHRTPKLHKTVVIPLVAKGYLRSIDRNSTVEKNYVTHKMRYLVTRVGRLL